MKNPYRFTPVLIVLLAVSLGACTFDWRRNKDTGTDVRGSLEVPPDLARPGGPETLPPVAPRATVPAATPTTAAPAAAAPAAVEPDARVQLERDGALRWLVVRDEPLRVWQQLRDYFIRGEIKLVSEDATALTLETDWIDRPVKFGDGFLSGLFSKLHSSGLRDKYKVRIERGRVPATVEVYVSHQGLEEIVTEGGGVSVVRTAWLPRPADPRAEAELIAKLMTHLGGDGKLAALPATASSAVPRVKGDIRIASEDLDGAWRRVGLALDRGGVIIEDRDRAAAIYYVQFKSSSGKDKKAGLFSWLTSDKPLDDKETAVPVDRFQVTLKADADGIVVSVRDVRGEPAASAAGEELLNLLNQQLH